MPTGLTQTSKNRLQNRHPPCQCGRHIQGIRTAWNRCVRALLNSVVFGGGNAVLMFKSAPQRQGVRDKITALTLSFIFIII